MVKADLHVHTSNTDCSYKAEDVFKMAKASGVTTVSITDHDTLYGVEEHKIIAKENNVGYIPGIEISAYDYQNKVPCHIVGLFVSEGYKPLEDMIDAVTKERHKHSEIQIQKLTELGYKISIDDFADKKGVHGIYKQHIMHVMLEKGYVRQMFGSFYSRMFKKGGPLYMQIDYPKHTDAVRVLAESGAFPILAHPTQYDNISQIKVLKDNGLFGMEVSYPSANTEESIKLTELCTKYELFCSGGSDYHGFYAKDTTGFVGSHYASDLSLLLEAKKAYSEVI